MPICLMYQPSRLDHIQYEPMRDSPLPQTEEKQIEQDNREGKPDIDIYLNKGTKTGTRNQTRDGIPD